MPEFEKSERYYYKVNQKNGKKTRISKQEYEKTQKKNTIIRIKSVRKTTTKKKKSVKKNIKKYMKGGSVEDFLSKFEERDENLVEIGRGGAGIIYLDKLQPDSVFKVSKEGTTCREWGKESKIYNRLNTYNIDTPLCKILKMKDHKFKGEICSMELTRAFNPRGTDVYYTIQPLFQFEEFNEKYETRGLFLGINNLLKENIFTAENITNYIKDLGIIMARLHYLVKNDGYDLELYISKIDDENTKIYIADFDLSEFYEGYPDKKIIERLSWSLEAVQYFPIEGELYSIFSSNYIDEAIKYDMGSVATEVLQEYSK